MNGQQPVLEVKALHKRFPLGKGLFDLRRQWVHAVDDVSFAIGQGETLGLVGESGCGKSTVGRTILRLLEPSSGEIILGGTDITRMGQRALRPRRRDMQIVFQDPAASLDPRMTAGEIVAELMGVHWRLSRAELGERVADLFRKVGLRPAQMANYPHEFSGGQRQRLSIARALSLEPKLIVCDEAVSALDVSIQAQVINLLRDLQQELDLSYLFISHDLAVVEHISHRVAVMYLGRIVEIADRAQLFAQPLHPYSESLLAAVPIPDPARRRKHVAMQGEIASPVNRPSGCAFHPRCPHAMAVCREQQPPLLDAGGGHMVACHLRQPAPAAFVCH